MKDEIKKILEKQKRNFDYVLLVMENISLKEKVEDLTKIIYKFTEGKKNFDLILGNQKFVFDKGGISFKPSLKQKSLKNIFVRASNSNITCTFCNNIGHVAFNC